MKKIALVAAGLAGLMLTACAPRYYDNYYDRDGYYHGDRAREYGDRYNDPYYGSRYRDRNYDDRAYDRDRY